MKVDYGAATGRHWICINGKMMYQGTGADVPMLDETVVDIVRAIFPDCDWMKPLRVAEVGGVTTLHAAVLPGKVGLWLDERGRYYRLATQSGARAMGLGSIADHLFIEQRGDGIWLVCVEKVHESMAGAQIACRKWMSAYSTESMPEEPETVRLLRLQNKVAPPVHADVLTYIDALRAHCLALKGS